MKKILILCLTLFIGMTLSCKTAYTAEDSKERKKIKIESSLNVSSETLQKIGASDSEQAIKVYNLSIVRAFSQCKTLDEMMTECTNFPPDYLVVSNGTINRIVAMDWNDEIYTSYAPSEVIEFESMKLATEEIISQKAIKLVSSDIRIEKSYFINGEAIRGDGIAVYYETNLGSYMYYVHWMKEYLIPLDTFATMMKTVDENRGPDTPPGAGIGISTFYDLTKYDINSENFDPDFVTATNHTSIILWVSIAAGVVLLAAAGIIVGIRIRKKRK